MQFKIKDIWMLGSFVEERIYIKLCYTKITYYDFFSLLEIPNLSWNASEND